MHCIMIKNFDDSWIGLEMVFQAYVVLIFHIELYII